jgi:hypothetical protein
MRTTRRIGSRLSLSFNSSTPVTCTAVVRGWYQSAHRVILRSCETEATTVAVMDSWKLVRVHRLAPSAQPGPRRGAAGEGTARGRRPHLAGPVGPLHQRPARRVGRAMVSTHGDGCQVLTRGEDGSSQHYPQWGLPRGHSDAVDRLLAHPGASPPRGHPRRVGVLVLDLADIRVARDGAATSRSLAPFSIHSTAASPTRSRRAPRGGQPPPSGYVAIGSPRRSYVTGGRQSCSVDAVW